MLSLKLKQQRRCTDSFIEQTEFYKFSKIVEKSAKIWITTSAILSVCLLSCVIFFTAVFDFFQREQVESEVMLQVFLHPVFLLPVFLLLLVQVQVLNLQNRVVLNFRKEKKWIKKLFWMWGKEMYHKKTVI